MTAKPCTATTAGLDLGGLDAMPAAGYPPNDVRAHDTRWKASNY